MRSNVEKANGLNRKLSIEVSAEEVSVELDKVYLEFRQGANIKGFRKGKAPLDKVKALYKAKAVEEASYRVIRYYGNQALEEHSLNPLGMPEIADLKGPLKEGADFCFSMEFEVNPEVHVQKYKGLEVQKEVLEISEEKVDQV